MRAPAVQGHCAAPWMRGVMIRRSGLLPLINTRIKARDSAHRIAVVVGGSRGPAGADMRIRLITESIQWPGAMQLLEELRTLGES